MWISRKEYEDNIYYPKYLNVNGFICYYDKSGKNRKCHNINGPAMFWKFDEIKFYWIEGKEYHTFIEYIKAVIKYKSEYNV